MSKQFVKKEELKLINGGYLSVGDKPVFHADFVTAQKSAEYVVAFAKHAKGKSFVDKKADSLEDIKKAVKEELATKSHKYVAAPDKPKQKLTDELAAEAKAFMTFKENTTKSEKINSFLAQFNVIHEFEEFGLFFSEDIVKLNKIYTMKEIIEAVTATIDLLD